MTTGARSDWEATRARILERDEHACIVCGGVRGGLYIDHVDALKGDSDENLRTLCTPHHREHCRAAHGITTRDTEERAPEPHPGIRHDLECDCAACTAHPKA